MKKFNLKEHIAKNKATFFGSLTEGYMGQFYAPEYLEQKYGKEMAKKIEAEIDEMDENSWDRFTGMESAKEVEDYIADIVSMLKESYSSLNESRPGYKPKIGSTADKYYKDAEADDAEHIEALEKDMKDDKKSSKMKKSELKAKIKEMVLAEMNLDVTDETSGYNFLAELEGMLNEAKEEEVEDEVDVDIEDPEMMDEPTGGINVTQNANADLTGTEKEVQDNLEAALEAAKKIGDEKLQKQIGNSLTFFTRQHVVKEGYYSTTNIESYIDAIGYESFEDFFNDNPGGESVLINWIESVPEFRQSLKGADLL